MPLHSQSEPLVKLGTEQERIDHSAFSLCERTELRTEENINITTIILR